MAPRNRVDRFRLHGATNPTSRVGPKVTRIAHRCDRRTRGPCGSRRSAGRWYGGRPHHRQPASRHPARPARGRAGRPRARAGRTARRVALVLCLHVGFDRAVDRPSVRAVVGLGPPAVEHRQVEDSVERRLHPTRAARLLGRTGHVHPDVAARDQSAGEREVVVLEERDPICHRGCALQAGTGRGRSPWRHRRAGCAFPANTNCTGRSPPSSRSGAVGPKREEVEPLVGREAAGEADGQAVGIEAVRPRLRRRSRSSPRRSRSCVAFARDCSMRTRRHSQRARPQLVVADVVDRRPRRRDREPSPTSPSPRWASSSARIDGASQVGTWTPLVTDG